MKTKLCVLRGAINHKTGHAVTGVFEWEGSSWRGATIKELVQELPAGCTDAELRAAYRAAVRAGRPESN